MARPENLLRVDVLQLAKIDHHPLRARFALVAGAALIEIRVAFPEARRVAIRQARIAVVIGLVDRVAPAWQPIAA